MRLPESVEDAPCKLAPPPSKGRVVTAPNTKLRSYFAGNRPTSVRHSMMTYSSNLQPGIIAKSSGYLPSRANEADALHRLSCTPTRSVGMVVSLLVSEERNRGFVSMDGKVTFAIRKVRDEKMSASVIGFTGRFLSGRSGLANKDIIIVNAPIASTSAIGLLYIP